MRQLQKYRGFVFLRSIGAYRLISSPRLIMMNLCLLLWVIFLTHSLSSFSQTTIITFPEHTSSSIGYSATFEDSYTDYHGPEVSLAQGESIRKFRIQQLSIFKILEGDNYLTRVFIFDTAGKIVAEEKITWQIGSKILWEYHRSPDRLFDYRIVYSRNDTVIRIDTIRNPMRAIMVDGKECYCRYVQVIHWKLGKLMNEQNAYYNEEYLNKAMQLPDYFGGDHDKKVVYLKHKLRTDYPPDQMIHAFDNYQCSTTECTGCCPTAGIVTDHDGEAFQEPTWSEDYGCGSWRSKTTTYRYDFNENGLPVKVFSKSETNYLDSEGSYNDSPEEFRSKPDYIIEYKFFE